MDIFKQKRLLVILIFVLVLFNSGLLFLIWNQNTGSTKTDQIRKSPEEMREELKHILKKELDFSQEQIEEYLAVRFEHNRKIIRLRRLISETKREMFDKVLLENSEQTLSDSLLSVAMDSQAEIERLTYEHLIALKNICTPEQRGKLQQIIHQIVAPPPGEMSGDLPPRGERRDGPPPPRR